MRWPLCLRYAAELGIYAAGRLGSTPAVKAENRAIDAMMLHTNEEIRAATYKALFGSDESKAAGAAALPAAAERLFGAIERMLERKRDPKSPFFFSKEGPSMADLAVYDNVSSPFPGVVKMGVDLSAFPKVLAVARAVEASPRIKAFVEKHGNFMLPVPEVPAPAESAAGVPPEVAAAANAK